MSQSIVSLDHVNKWFRDNPKENTKAVKDLTFDVSEGEFLTLLGPSGCGKTTTLRMISGFEFPTSGTIKVEGRDVQNTEPYERNVNTVFQNYALFPNMNVYDNIAYGLKVKKVPRAEIKERVNEMLRLVQLEGFGRRRISQMSGGQKQRVAIARALINRPKVLLLDEPLGALDLQLRKQMQIELKHLQRKLGLTFIYVTHDQEEAMTMSDRIGVMQDGVLQQLSAPEDLYTHPATRFVAGFVGESNIIDGKVFSCMAEGDGVSAVLETPYGKVTGMSRSQRLQEGCSAAVSIRPENMRFFMTAPEGFSLEGTVHDKIYIGNHVKILVKLKDGKEMRVMRLPGQELPSDGDTVYLTWLSDQSEVIFEQENA